MLMELGGTMRSIHNVTKMSDTVLVDLTESELRTLQVRFSRSNVGRH